MSDYLDINNEELLKDFFSEAEQQVDTLESNVLVIENDPSNHEAIDEIFRAAHTLKGGSATVEMHRAPRRHRPRRACQTIRRLYFSLPRFRRNQTEARGPPPRSGRRRTGRGRNAGRGHDDEPRRHPEPGRGHSAESRRHAGHGRR